MAKLVGAFCVPHIPLILSQPGVADKNQSGHVMEAFSHISDRLRELNVDTVIVIGDDHYTMFGPQLLPSMTIAIGDLEGPHEDWLGPKRAPILNNPELASHIMECGFEKSFDWAVSKAMVIDHSTFVPYEKIIKLNRKVKMIPIYIAAGVTPLIKPQRCVQLGELIRDSIKSFSGDDRVAIIGTGGLSHWVGSADMGKVNEEFDQQFLAMVERRDIDGILSLDDDVVLETAGNGALEYRNWLVAMAATYEYEYELLCYEAIHPWVTGTAAVEFKMKEDIQ